MWECLTGLTRSAVSSPSALQKSSRPVSREVFSLEMVPIEANTFMATFTKLLFSIYNFYHSSALNRDNLNTSCAAVGINSLVPSRVGGTTCS